MTDVQNGVPVTSNTVSPEYKSVVPSVFFGFFAAPFQAHNAKKRGLRGNRYWAAAAITTFAGIALMVVLAVVVGLAASKAINAQDPVINPSAINSPPSGTSVAPPSDALILPTESIYDSPEQVVENVETIHFRAFRYGNTAYLDHCFLNSSLSGYAASVARVLPGGQPSEVTETDIVVISNNKAGSIVAKYTIHWNDTPAQRVKTHFVFSSGEWLVESSFLA